MGYRDQRERYRASRHQSYGRGFDAWGAGKGFRPAGFDYGPEEGPGPGGIEDKNWGPHHPGRQRARWSADWDNDSQRHLEWHRERSGYRGRGPKDYRRADDRIRDDACERLTDDWLVDATDITVVVQDGEVTLSGFVTTREQKRRAEDCVEQIGGVRDVINQLRVSRDADRMERGGSQERPAVAADRRRSGSSTRLYSARDPRAKTHSPSQSACRCGIGCATADDQYGAGF